MKGLVLISSPLQLFLSLSIKSRFNLSSLDYVFFRDNTSNRHMQMEIMAKMYNINYYYESGYVSLFDQLKLSFRKTEKKYDYLFIGLFYQGLELVYLPFLKNNGCLFYLDDGNNSIDILKGNFTNNKFLFKRKLFKMRFMYKNYSMDNFYTIYKNIKSKIFNIVQNELHIEDLVNESDNCIYIIGTNASIYAKFVGLTLEQFYARSKNFLKELKNNTTKRIVFIPHGRDTSDVNERICKQLDIEYRRIDMCIELYFMLNKIYPSSIYGFGSTALYILKCIYPSMDIINLFMKGENCDGCVIYERVNNYLLTNNVQTIYV